MKNAQQPDHSSLSSILNRLNEGRYVIPDFQREFEWEPWDIRDLMRSIFLDYYIGSLLLWKGKNENFDALSCTAIYGFKSSGNPEYIVLDGQQRLTAIYYAFLAPDVPLPNRTSRAFYYIKVDKYMAEEYDIAFGYDWHSKQWNEILSNREKQYASHLFPLSLIGSGGYELASWLQEYERFWKAKAAEVVGDDDELGKVAKTFESYAVNAKIFEKQVYEITGEYRISYIVLDKDILVDKVCDIFTQINSKGVQLDVFDLINALLRPKGLQLKHMWHDAATRLSGVDTKKMNVYILQVMSILRQAYCSPKYLYFLLPGQEKPIRDPDGTRRKEVLISDIGDFKAKWDAAVDAIENAIKLLRHPQEYGVVNSNFLPYVSILPIFSAIRAHSKTLPPHRQLDARRKLRHWYWSSVFLNRYSGSVESTSARDFLDLKAWFEDDAAEPALVSEFGSRFRNLELRKEIRRGSSVYNGIFNLLVLQGARDWVTGDVPLHDDLDDHHIVPDSWGKSNLGNNLIGTILNRTPLTSDTNRHVIRDRLPNAYLPELIEQNGENTVRSILESHFISSAALAILLRNPFTPDDYEAFISERQRTIQDAIENLLIKERLDLEPQLRELDSKVESVELRLRALVLDNLGDDTTQIPPHIIQKVTERISGALKKNAAMDAGLYATLAGMLEYFDLREIQDTIAAKTLWMNFEAVFANKEVLYKKFDQLAELRNGIRHSRSVSQIVKMEGEASILWFNQVLG